MIYIIVFIVGVYLLLLLFGCIDVFINRRRRVNKVKKWKRSKKYKLQEFGLRLKRLPFSFSPDEIIFVENGYDDRLNQMIKRNLDFIQACFNKNKHTHLRFVYLPNIIKEILQDEEAISYIAPTGSKVPLSSGKELKSNFLLDYMVEPGNRDKIPPCFIRFKWDSPMKRARDYGCGFLDFGNKTSIYSVFDCIGFNPDENIDEKTFFRDLCSAFDYLPRPEGSRFSSEIIVNDNQERADNEFDEESKRLMSEVEERIRKLRKRGISQWVLVQLVKPELKLSQLVITKDYRILLPDYHDMEIKMEPLVKAVYLLFLQNPEGILFKDLPDYREELEQIYVKLKPYGMNERVRKSIEDVTNPMLNSINEKCARIRGAFVSQFDDSIAKNYYITGLRGEPKLITLPRDLVIWEE